MNWHTSNKAALEKHPAFAALPEAFRDSITEALPTLSIWRKAGPLPTGTRWDAATNSIVFPEPIELSRLTAIRFSTRPEWLYVPGSANPQYGGTLSADGRSLRVVGVYTASLSGEALSGGYTVEIQAYGYKGDMFGAPADWVRPVGMFNIETRSDPTTFDGRAKLWTAEARTVSTNTPTTCLWCYLQEIGVGTKGTSPAADDSIYRERVEVLEAAIRTLNESIKK